MGDRQLGGQHKQTKQSKQQHRLEGEERGRGVGGRGEEGRKRREETWLSAARLHVFRLASRVGELLAYSGLPLDVIMCLFRNPEKQRNTVRKAWDEARPAPY